MFSSSGGPKFVFYHLCPIQAKLVSALHSICEEMSLSHYRQISKMNKCIFCTLKRTIKQQIHQASRGSMVYIEELIQTFSVEGRELSSDKSTCTTFYTLFFAIEETPIIHILVLRKYRLLFSFLRVYEMDLKFKIL